MYPASPNFLHISIGNSLSRSVFAATSSGISRPIIIINTPFSWAIASNPRMNSCTCSRRSVRSSGVGGTNPVGCLEEAGRLKQTKFDFGLKRPIWRSVLVRARGTANEGIDQVEMPIMERVYVITEALSRKCGIKM